MITRMISARIQLMRAGSAAFGYPAAVSAAVHLSVSQPSIWVWPIDTDGAVPAGAASVVKESPCLVRKSLALSHSVNLDHGPTKMWKLQVAGSTRSTTGLAVWNSLSAGLMALVSPWNSGK